MKRGLFAPACHSGRDRPTNYGRIYDLRASARKRSDLRATARIKSDLRATARIKSDLRATVRIRIILQARPGREKGNLP
jgi:hypothetical protein